MKTVLITGASQGLGKVLAEKLANENYQVLLLARSEELLKQNAASIKKAGGQAEVFVCDIRDRLQVNNTIAAILQNYSIDVLVNNAGVWTDDELQQDKPGLMEEAFKTNTLGNIYVIEALLPYLKKKNQGKILSVISSAGALGIPAGDNTNWKVYGASKWGLVGYTNALKESLRDTKIQVIQFLPGGFESNLYENATRPKAHNQPWMMKTEDVADCVLFALNRPEDVYVEKLVISKMM